LIAGDGSISTSELHHVLTTLGSLRMSEQDVHSILERFDVDGDGNIDYTEFVMGLLEENPTERGLLAQQAKEELSSGDGRKEVLKPVIIEAQAVGSKRDINGSNNDRKIAKDNKKLSSVRFNLGDTGNAAAPSIASRITNEGDNNNNITGLEIENDKDRASGKVTIEKAQIIQAESARMISVKGRGDSSVGEGVAAEVEIMAQTDVSSVLGHAKSGELKNDNVAAEGDYTAQDESGDRPVGVSPTAASQTINPPIAEEASTPSSTATVESAKSQGGGDETHWEAL